MKWTNLATMSDTPAFEQLIRVKPRGTRCLPGLPVSCHIRQSLRSKYGSNCQIGHENLCHPAMELWRMDMVMEVMEDCLQTHAYSYWRILFHL